MKKIALIILGLLVGCEDNVPDKKESTDMIIKPEPYTHTESVPFKILSRTTLPKPSIDSALLLDVTINPENTTPTQRAATAINIAADEYNKMKRSSIYVYLLDEKNVDLGNVAFVRFFPKKCGIMEDNCDGIMWDVYTADNTPTDLDRESFALWSQYKETYLTESGLTDEDKIEDLISSKLGINKDDVTYFQYNHYSSRETF